MGIQSKTFFGFDPARVPSPCYVVDEVVIEKNLKVLNRLQQESGVKVLLALKAFSMFSLAPLVTQNLSGCCASGLHESLLAHEYFGCCDPSQELHVYSPAYDENEFNQICKVADHIVFNSFSQWHFFQEKVKQIQKIRSNFHCGLRINPLFSTTRVERYDPCSAMSRLGIPADLFHKNIHNIEDLKGISGLHFHTLCEQGFAPLEDTLNVVEQQFEEFLPHMKWLNLGGGHHLTQDDYDIESLIEKIKLIQKKYQLQVYLEPGEAIAIKSGVLVSEVRDITYNQIDLAIMDSSAICHMPDTIEMPYRAEVFVPCYVSEQIRNPCLVAGKKNEKRFNYRMGGLSCLAGDVMGDYSFDHPIKVGQRLLFDDMAHYTMVKTSTFNGVPLPSIAIWNSDTDKLYIVKRFGYQDFKQRLS